MTTRSQCLPAASKAMAAAARIAKNRGAEADMMEIRFRAERRIGALMAMQKAAGKMNKGLAGSQVTGSQTDPVRDNAPTLSEVGIDKHLADRARKYAAIKEQEFNERVEKYREAVVREGEKARADLLSIGSTRGTRGTGENEWYPVRHTLHRWQPFVSRINSFRFIWTIAEL